MAASSFQAISVKPMRWSTFSSVGCHLKESEKKTSNGHVLLVYAIRRFGEFGCRFGSLERSWHHTLDSLFACYKKHERGSRPKRCLKRSHPLRLTSVIRCWARGSETAGFMLAGRRCT